MLLKTLLTCILILPFLVQAENQSYGRSGLQEKGEAYDAGSIRIYREMRERRRGRIEIGSKVLTPSLQKGTVTGILPGPGEAVVSVPYLGSTRYPVYDLAVTEGCTDGFCVGEKVITPQLQQGTVLGFFRDGDLVIEVQYLGNSRLRAETAGFTTGCTENFCVGDKTITPNNQNGTVIGLLSNGEVVVSVQYLGNSKHSADRLAVTEAICTNIYYHRATYCSGARDDHNRPPRRDDGVLERYNFGAVELFRERRERRRGRIKIGSQVVTKNMNTGTVAGILPASNEVVVNVPYLGQSRYSLNDVAVTKGCTDGFCVEDAVVTSSMSSGKVVGYFNNGDIVVSIPYLGTSRHSPHSLGITRGCTYDFCVGDKVITPRNNNGTVVALLATGEIVVTVEYLGSAKYRTDQLAVTEAICTNIYRHRPYRCSN
jgi:hypothetical protein